jgi:hypothetical protein
MRTAMAMVLLISVAGVAQAQVSSEEYPKYFDYIMDHDWYCLTKQPFDYVQSGVLETNMTLQFDRDTATYQSYRFKGNGSQVFTLEGRDYHGRFRMEGFGVNDSSFGTGVSIVAVTPTSGDPLPNGWTWDPSDYVNLHLVSEKAGSPNPYYLEGWDEGPGGRTTIECVVDTGRH